MKHALRLQALRVVCKSVVAVALVQVQASFVVFGNHMAIRLAVDQPHAVIFYVKSGYSPYGYCVFSYKKASINTQGLIKTPRPGARFVHAGPSLALGDLLRIWTPTHCAVPDTCGHYDTL
jgi:hypothetical protein